MGSIYDLNTVAHAVGTAKTQSIAEQTLANIKFVRSTAEAYRMGSDGRTAVSANAHMEELIQVCNQEQAKLEALGEALHRNGTFINSTDEDGGQLFTGYLNA